MSLINSFKNFRRKRVNRNEKKPTATSPKASTSKKKSPGVSGILTQPVVPPGEDRVSFQRHRKVLQVEYAKKGNGNKQVVADLMDRTFAQRRADILEHDYDILALFNNYPFLQNNDEVYTQ